jgi:phage I-like protein
MISIAAATEVQRPPPGANGQWVHLIPSGSFKGKDGRGPYRAENLNAIISASRQRAGGRPLPVDYDHQIDLASLQGGSARAAGWINEMQARADGIWGFAEWTPSAKAALDAREYRFLSPVFAHSPNGRVSALLRAGLTNNPNLTQLTALNAAGTTMLTDEMMQTLCDLLELPTDSDPADVIQAVRDMVTSKNTVDPAKFVPIQLFQQAVAAANQASAGISRQSAEIAVDQAARDGKIMPFMREWSLSLCMVNKPAFDAFLASTGPSIHSFLGGLTTPLAHDWNPHGGGTHNDGANEVMTRLGLTADDIKKYGNVGV